MTGADALGGRAGNTAADRLGGATAPRELLDETLLDDARGLNDDGGAIDNRSECCPLASDADALRKRAWRGSRS